MDKLTDMASVYGEGLSTFVSLAAEFLPKLVMAILIRLITWFIAKAVQKWISLLGGKLWLNKVAEKAHIAWFLRDANFGTLSNILGKIAYWVIYLIGITMVFDTLNLQVVSDLISSLVGYLPNLFVAVLIIVIGAFIANMVKDLVNGAVKASKAKIGTWAGQIAYVVVMFSTVMTALNQAQIDISFITDNINTIVMGIMLAAGLAFGLGGKDKARDILEKMM